MSIAIGSKLIEFFGGNDFMKIDDDVYNVYFSNSIAKPTLTVWIYNKKVCDTLQRKYEFSINENLHIYSTTI